MTAKITRLLTSKPRQPTKHDTDRSESQQQLSAFTCPVLHRYTKVQSPQSTLDPPVHAIFHPPTIHLRPVILLAPSLFTQLHPNCAPLSSPSAKSVPRTPRAAEFPLHNQQKKKFKGQSPAGMMIPSHALMFNLQPATATEPERPLAHKPPYASQQSPINPTRSHSHTQSPTPRHYLYTKPLTYTQPTV